MSPHPTNEHSSEQPAVADLATVPLFYEDRAPVLQLVNPELSERIYKIIEASELDPDQESRLDQVLRRQYHLITREDRLEKIAKDIVQHFIRRGFVGKALVVSLDKATALRMYEKVRNYWELERKSVTKELQLYDITPEEELDLKARLAILNRTDMAVVVAPAAQEIEQMQKLGLDIAPHRARMNEERLDEKFKDAKDPLSLVFVCTAWLTAADAPSCSTVYLDKPMRTEMLRRTIACATGVFPDKQSGLILDYANVFSSVARIRGLDGARVPAQAKTELIEELRRAVAEATRFCEEHGISLAGISSTPRRSAERMELVANAVSTLFSKDTLMRAFTAQEQRVDLLHQAVKPDAAVLEFIGITSCLAAIAEEIRNKSAHF